MAQQHRSEGHVSLEALGDMADERAPITLRSIEKKQRMSRVLQHMRDDDVDLLYERYVEALTLQEMADTRNVSVAAVHKRVTTARANFLVAFERWWDND